MGKFLESIDRSKRTAVRSSGPPRHRETVGGSIEISRRREHQASQLVDGTDPVGREGQNVGNENRDGQVQVEVTQGPARKKTRRTEEESNTARNDDEESDAVATPTDANENDEVVEKMNIWEDLGRNAEESLTEEAKAELRWKKQVNRFKNKQDEPEKAFLLECVKEYCGKEVRKIFADLRLNDEDKEELSRKWDKKTGLDAKLDTSRQQVILAKFLLDRVQDNSLFKLMSKMKLESGWELRNNYVWKAYEIQSGSEGTMAFEQFQRKMRNKFNRISDEEERQFARATVKDDMIFVCIVTKAVKNGKTKYSVAYFATDKKLPYLFIRGQPDKSMIQDVSLCLGGTGVKDCKLSVVGLDTVLGACKQPSSATILATMGDEIQEQLRDEGRPRGQGTGCTFMSFEEHLRSMGADVEVPNSKLQAEVMKVEPEPEGGMKRLKLEFKQPDGKKSVKFKVTTKKGGSMSADLAEMYKRGHLSDSARKAFLLAKDKKTNNLKLDWSEENGWTAAE